jgi:surfactin synthase thioesterase subunit/acyl carrier protein
VRLRSALPDAQFESAYSLQRFGYLNDHRIYGMAVLPTTVGLTALRDAACQYFHSNTIEVTNLQYREAMVLPEDGERIVQTILTPLDESTAEFRFTSTGAIADDMWRTHMVGMAHRIDPAQITDSVPLDFDGVSRRCTGGIPIDRYYETLRVLGLEYGVSFRAIEMLQRGDGEVLTRVRLPSPLSIDHQFGLHPALLDACLHLYPALVEAYGDFTKPAEGHQGTYLPVNVARFRGAETRATEVWAHGLLRRAGNDDPEILTVDITVYQSDGRFAAAIEGLRLKSLSPEALRSQATTEAGLRSHRQAGQGVSVDAAAIKSQLRDAPVEKRRELLIGHISQQAMKTLGIAETIDSARPLREFGLDSLMSVTLVNRLESSLGIKISTVNMIQGPSVEQLVDEILPDMFGVESGSQEITLQPQSDPVSWPVTVWSRAGDEVQPNIEVQANASADKRASRTDPLSTDQRLSVPVSTAPNGPTGDWLVTVGPRTAPRFRLFCFPFAGGGSGVYRNWAHSIDPAIEVIAIEPPGRLARISETPITDVDEFIDQLVPEMSPLLDRPFTFFGHCLGALTMYETTRRLIHTTTYCPDHLFVSGARPPDRIADHGLFEERLMHDLLKLTEFRIGLPAYAQSEDVFAELIRHFNIQATDQLLAHPELRKLILPVVRAEFQMATNYQFKREQPWEIPITCFAAKGDPYVSRKHALGWGRFTNLRLQVHIREGAHFAVVDDMAFIHDVINSEMRVQSGQNEYVETIPDGVPW